MTPNSIDTVPDEIIDRFRCPECADRVTRQGGGLRCHAGHFFAMVDGVLNAQSAPRDLLTDRTFRSFGYEWNAFAAIQPEDKEFWREFYFADVPLDEIRNSIAIDAGCGKGRYSYFTAGCVKALVALDGSDAVHAAARNLADLENVVVVRSDLRDAPFADASFGFVTCLGVLHHLSEPRRGLSHLVRILEPNGLLLLYVYSRAEHAGLRRVGHIAARGLRQLTVRLPHPIVRMLSLPLAASLYGLFVLPGTVAKRRGWPLLAGLPLATYRGKPLRSLWLDTLDRLSAPREERYSLSDLQPWFEAEGLDVMSCREAAGLFILARRRSA